MNTLDAATLAVIGIVAAIIGSFGTHLLTSFNGRSLESYCRLRRRRERFGQILDLQESGTTACTYLFLVGVTFALVFGTVFVVSHLPTAELQKRLSDRPMVATMPRFQAAVFLITTCLALMSIRIWLPQLVVQDRASKVLYHTWALWRFLTFISLPLQTLEAFFEWLGHRLGDEIQDIGFEEESLEDEIRTMVTVGEREGLMRKGMRDMIQGVMNLDENPVQNIMTHRSEIDAIDIQMPWPEMIAAVNESGRTRLPVYDGTVDHVVGILFVKDLLTFLNTDENSDLVDIRPLLRDAWQVPGSRPVYELLRDFLHRRSHMAIVVDDFSETIGVVTIEDVLEEIVGEIADELDEDEGAEITQHENGAIVEAQGRVSVEKFNQVIGWDLPISDDYETLAGLVITRIGSIPREGTVLSVGPVEITVRNASDRQLKVLRLRHNEAEIHDQEQYMPVRSIAQV